MEKINKEGKNSKFLKILGIIIASVSLLIGLFHVFISFNTAISINQQRIFHTLMLIFIGYCYQTKSRYESGKKSYVVFSIIAIITLAVGAYYIMGSTASAMSDRGINGATIVDVVFGVILICLILDLTRRLIGVALTVIAGIFIIYALFGPYMPSTIAHKGYDIAYITNYVAWTMEGIFGTSIGASVAFVALYIIFGELLDKFGAGKFFIDLAYAMTGRMKGGPAEASVISSALMGSINGSVVANVVTTGTFTIPLMKRVGYSDNYAGAVEAVASTGGQILPPVMGAAAFVMADMTGIAYSSIIIAAIIPGLLFYIALGISVFLKAGKLGLKAEKYEDLPRIKKVLKDGWYHAIPIAVLIIALLGFNLSANYSALFAIVALLIVGGIQKLVSEKRFPIKEIYQSLVAAGKTTVPVAMACASAGIVIGIVSMTGIGVKFTRIVFELAGGNMFAMLLLIMLACIVMGMGLPSTAAYVIAATIGAPPLIQAGMPVLAAHMFVFYFAIMSFITPPVAIAAYAASGLSGGNSMKTGMQAFLLGLSGFIIPFVYAYNPALLIVGYGIGEILYIALLTLFAIFLLSTAISGWFIEDLKWPIRTLMIMSAILIFVQGSMWFDIIGVSSGVAIVLMLTIIGIKKSRKEKACQSE